MKQSEENTAINKEFKAWLNDTKKITLNKDVSELIEKMAPSLEILSESRVAAFVYDYGNANYCYFNDYFAVMMNMSRKDILAEGIGIMHKNVHPQDFLKCLNITKKSILEVGKMKEHEKKTMRFRLFFRMKCGKGQYAWIMQSNKHFSLNKNLLDMGYLIELFDPLQPIKVMGILETANRRMELYSDDDMDLLGTLTLRELEVLQLIKHGMESREVAAHLSITENTVKAHRRNLMNKLNVRKMVQAVGMLDKI